MSWWQLHAIYREAAELQTDWRTQPLPACPNDGEPLTAGPNGVRYCQYDGWTDRDRRWND